MKKVFILPKEKEVHSLKDVSKKDQNHTNKRLFRSGESSSIKEIFERYESFDRRIEEIEKLYGHV